MQTATKQVWSRAEIEALRAKRDEALRRERAAVMDRSRAEAELAEAEGRLEDRDYHLDYLAAQMHQPGAHAQFMRRCWRRDALRISRGEDALDDHPAWERGAIAAELERLRAEVQP